MSATTTHQVLEGDLKPVRGAVARAMDTAALAVEAAQGAAALATMEAAHPNKTGLDRMVAVCLRDAAYKDEPARYLRLNAEKLERFLHQLDRATAGASDLPSFLIGLSALDISEGMDRLRSAALVIERDGLGAFVARAA